MDKWIMILSIAMTFSIFTLSSGQETASNHNSDFGGEDLNDDIIVSDFSPETIFTSDESSVVFDASDEDTSNSYSAPEEEQNGVEIAQNSSAES